MTVLTTAVPDTTLAEVLAARTGELLLRLRESHGFTDPASLRANGDRQAHEYILAELSRLRLDDALLSEEGEHRGSDRAAADRVWIVDPLDGTREYGEPGRSDWAVHVALWERGDLVAGAVALPARNLVLTTQKRPASVAGSEQIRIVTSRTRPPSFLAEVAQRVGGILIPMGSAGAKVAAVVCGEADAYIHAGGQYEWDSAAPVAVAAAAGLHTSRIDGSPLAYNQPDPLLPDLLVCRSELAQPLLAAIAACAQPAGKEDPHESQVH